MATKKSPKAKNINTEFDFKTIKSFEDACKKEGIDPTALPDISMIPEEFRKAIISCYKLFIIFKAINNGWIPDWNNYDQYKYYPWFKILSSGSGFVFSYSYYGYHFTFTCVGSRLCFKTKELAQYAGTQFIEIYRDYLTIKK